MHTAGTYHSVALEVEESQNALLGFALGKSIYLSELIGFKVGHASFRLEYPNFILDEAPF